MYMSSYITLDRKLKEKYGYYAVRFLLQSYERKTFKYHERNMYLCVCPLNACKVLLKNDLKDCLVDCLTIYGVISLG